MDAVLPTMSEHFDFTRGKMRASQNVGHALLSPAITAEKVRTGLTRMPRYRQEPGVMPVHLSAETFGVLYVRWLWMNYCWLFERSI